MGILDPGWPGDDVAAPLSGPPAIEPSFAVLARHVTDQELPPDSLTSAQAMRSFKCGARWAQGQASPLDRVQELLTRLPRYAFDQQGVIYGPVDAGPGTFLRHEDVETILTSQEHKR